MKLTARFTSLSEVQADWLIVPVWEDAPFPAAVAQLDARLLNVLTRLREAGDMCGKANELVPVLTVDGIAAKRVLVVGLGKRDRADRISLHDAASAAARRVTDRQRGHIAFALPEDVPNLGAGDVARAVGTGLRFGCHGPGLRKREPARFLPEELSIIAPPSAPREEIESAVQRASAEGKAVALARELVNTPPCDLYPESFAARAREAAGAVGLECAILDEKQLEAERMGALLAVARGSERPPRLVVLRHTGAQSDRTLGLVGKGVTFDSGGLSLKTNEQMLDMKCDMAGAAAVLAAMLAAAELRLPVNLVGVLALVENMPSGQAMKLGDVLRARNGKTIEVLNTDAEGRLILADALAYTVDQKVHHLVDLATLTGACMIALGTEVAGLMGNNDPWSRRVLAAADRAGERAWPLPMFALYDPMIKSHVADMKNTGGSRYGGAITGAKLLEQFVGDVPWAHLDIAGPSWADSENATRDAGGTGCFVRTLIELASTYESGT